MILPSVFRTSAFSHSQDPKPTCGARPLLNHLIGAAEQRERDGEAERLGGLEVDDQLDLGGLLDRQVGGLLALENPASVDADQTELVRTVASVAHQAAGGDKLAIGKNRGHRMAYRRIGDLFAPADEERIR